MSPPVVRIAVLQTPPSLKIKLLPKPVVQVRALTQIPAQVSVVSTTTSDPGTDASVVNIGTPGNARLQFTIPRGDVGPQGATGPQGDQGPQGIQGEQGDKGDTGDTGAAGPANSLSIGTVVDGVTADATITGTAPSQTLNLTLPKGDKGDKGDQGDPGADGVVQSLVAGSNINIDATDPANPIINSTASGSGDVVGPASAVDGTPAVFDGTTGKLIKNITYAAFKTLLSLVKGDVGLGNVDNTSDATKNAAAVALTNKDLTSGTNTFPTLNQNTTGSAAKLTTARTIDGQSFDGTANITVIAPGTHAATGKTTPVDADELALVDSAASNVLKKLTWANLKATLASTFLTWAPVRERLSANRTYYVLTTGSDSNNGLANTSGGAFLTIQKAINTVAALDLSIYNVTIQVGAGTYTGTVLVNGPWVGLGSVSLVGDTTTPTNVIISTTSADCITLQNNGVLNVGGFKLTTTTSGNCLNATANGTIYITGAMNFGSTPTNSTHLSASNGGKIFNIGGANLTISGGSFAHMYAQQLGGIVYAAITVTVSGTPAFSYAFAAATNVGFVRSASVTYSGSATGARYNASVNSVVQTDGGGASVFPGSTAGSTSTGGQYL